MNCDKVLKKMRHRISELEREDARLRGKVVEVYERVCVLEERRKNKPEISPEITAVMEREICNLIRKHTAAEFGYNNVQQLVDLILKLLN